MDGKYSKHLFSLIFHIQSITGPGYEGRLEPECLGSKPDPTTDKQCDLGKYLVLLFCFCICIIEKVIVSDP